MNRLIISAVAALVTSTTTLAGTIQKDSFYGFGAGVDIPPFIAGCLSVQFGNFRIGESAATQPKSDSLVRSAQIAIFGENTCSGVFFFSSGITESLVFVKSPTGDLITGSGTIPVFTIDWGNELVAFDIVVTATGQRLRHQWGTNNVIDSGIRVTQSIDDIGKPAVATLNISGSLTGAPYTNTVANGPSTIGSQKFSSTLIGLPNSK